MKASFALSTLSVTQSKDTRAIPLHTPPFYDYPFLIALRIPQRTELKNKKKIKNVLTPRSLRWPRGRTLISDVSYTTGSTLKNTVGYDTG